MQSVYWTGVSPKTLFVDERNGEVVTSDMYSMSVDVLESDMSGLLLSTPEQMENVRILQHFQGFTSLTLGGVSCQEVMHSFVSKRAWKYPYLM